jgi:undecaprenyl diphosphate synthase
LSSSETVRPRHIAIIMDGNGRWAKKRGLPRAAGHQSGFRTTRDIVEACVRERIEDLFLRALKSEVSELHENKVCIRFIGERSAFDEKLQEQMSRAEELTANNKGLKLSIAVNYGGRWDIINAAKQIARKARDGQLDPETIDVDTFSAHVSLSDICDPDLFIRTGGEKRISNYLLWHLAYTELRFTDVLWPDFSDVELGHALEFYAGRQRRFGRTGEQVQDTNA